METKKYGLFIELGLPYAQALAATKDALKAEGFGVLTEIDVRATMKEKLNAEFRGYTIIGACNPPLAHQALSTELDIGLLLPCNVIVYDNEAGGSSVGALDPEQMMGVTGNTQLSSVAAEAKTRLTRALESLEAIQATG